MGVACGDLVDGHLELHQLRDGLLAGAAQSELVVAAH